MYIKDLGRLLAAVMLLGVASSAWAADLRNGLKDVPVVAIETVDWTGLYIGVHGGHAWGQFDGSRTMTHGAPPFGYETHSDVGTLDVDGWFGGAGISYKVQRGVLILEPFADASFGGGDASTTWTRGVDAYIDDGGRHDISEFGITESGSIVVKKRWGGTVGLKGGILVSQRDYLYVLGGLAYGNFDLKAASALSGGGQYSDYVATFPAGAHDSNKGLWGFTVGAGWENAITDRLHLGLEGRYTSFAGLDSTFDGSAEAGKYTLTTLERIGGDFDEWSVLGRISYRTK